MASAGVTPSISPKRAGRGRNTDRATSAPHPVNNPTNPARAEGFSSVEMLFLSWLRAVSSSVGSIPLYRSGVMVMSDSSDMAMLCLAFCVGLKGDVVDSSYAAPLSPVREGPNLRSSGTDSKEDARQQKLRIDIARLHKQEKREADDRVADDSDPSHTEAVGNETPNWAGDEGDNLVDETKCADNITDAIFDAYEVCDHEGDAAVEEHQERDGEERYAEE
ncbi:hypothetical protein BN1708_006514, partial [Verticillium longisporum]